MTNQREKILVCASIFLHVYNAVLSCSEKDSQSARKYLGQAKFRLKHVPEECREEFFKGSSDEEFNTLLRRYMARFNPSFPQLTQGDLSKLRKGCLGRYIQLCSEASASPVAAVSR